MGSIEENQQESNNCNNIDNPNNNYNSNQINCLSNSKENNNKNSTENNKGLFSGNLEKIPKSFGLVSSSCENKSKNMSTPILPFYGNFENPKIYDSNRLYSILHSKIDVFWIGVEKIGSEFLHVLNTQIFGGARKFLPTPLGGNYPYHSSCFIQTQNNFSIMIEYGGYEREQAYKNYTYYVFNKEGGIRFTEMSFDDFMLIKIKDNTKSFMLSIPEKYKITVKQLLQKCCENDSWKSKDYDVIHHNCQDFIAKCIKILHASRYNMDHRGDHNESKVIFPPGILLALEENEKNYAPYL